MKSKRTVFSIVCIALLLVGFLLLIPKIEQHKEIQLGNETVSRIEQYRKEKQTLPETGDWEVLKQIGFQLKGEDTWPSYNKIDENHFQLFYPKGFDGPYLMYDSIEKAWTIGSPKIIRK